MRIKSLAQGENILMLGIKPSTFVSKVDILTTTPIVHNCTNAFYFHALSLFIDTVCLFHFFISIMHSAFNLFVFPNSMFTPLLFFVVVVFLYERAMSSPKK